MNRRYLVALWLIWGQVATLAVGQAQWGDAPNGGAAVSAGVPKAKPAVADAEAALLWATVPGQGPQGVVALERRLDAFVAEVKAARVMDAPLHKALAALSKRVSAAFFKAYRDDASLGDLLRQGHYNDATATALHALLLRRLGVPFAVVSGPFDTHLIAAPAQGAIPVAAPSHRVPEGEARFVAHYLGLVGELGLLEVGMGQHTQAALFHRHYMPPKVEVGMGQLAGVLHYKTALSLYGQGDFAAALRLFEQAEAHFPLPRHQVMRIACLLQLAKGYDPAEPDSFYWLLALYKVHPAPGVRQEILSAFASASEGGVGGLYGYLCRHLAGAGDILADVKALYFASKVGRFAREGQDSLLLPYLDSLQAALPHDTLVQSALAGVLLSSVGQGRDFAKGLSVLEPLMVRHPVLLRHAELHAHYLFYQAERIKHHFDRNDGTVALAHLARFEGDLAKGHSTPKRANAIKTAYLAASDYYFRAADYATALRLIERGLDLLPEDFYFVHRRNLLRNY